MVVFNQVMRYNYMPALKCINSQVNVSPNKRTRYSRMRNVCGLLIIAYIVGVLCEVANI